VTEPAAPYHWFSVWDYETDAYEPPLHGACATLVARLVELVPVWHRLKVAAGDTTAVHDAGRLWAVVTLRDRVHGGRVFAELRVEVTDTSWAGAWVVHPSNTVRDLANVAWPDLRTGGDTDVVESAVGWLRAQLQRPVVYREWRRHGTVLAYNWTTEDDRHVIYQFETPPRRQQPAITERVRP
jgi:hypothetical protein